MLLPLLPQAAHTRVRLISCHLPWYLPCPPHGPAQSRASSRPFFPSGGPGHHIVTLEKRLITGFRILPNTLSIHCCNLASGLQGSKSLTWHFYGASRRFFGYHCVGISLPEAVGWSDARKFGITSRVLDLFHYITQGGPNSFPLSHNRR
jgi:hypothetical protein